jgi:hypothetical protein
MEATRPLTRNPLDAALAASIAITVTYALAVTAFDSTFWAIQLEFTFWCTAWAIIAHRTFTERHSGFPTWLLPFNVSWEAFAIRGYLSPMTGWVPLAQKPFFVLWFALSCVHLYGVSRFNRSDLTGEKNEKWFWPVMIGLLAVLLVGYAIFSDQPGGEVKHCDLQRSARRRSEALLHSRGHRIADDLVLLRAHDVAKKRRSRDLASREHPENVRAVRDDRQSTGRRALTLVPAALVRDHSRLRSRLHDSVLQEAERRMMDLDVLKRREFLRLMSGALAGTGLFACAGPLPKPTPSNAAYGAKGKVFLSLSDADDRSTIRIFDWDSGEHRDVEVPIGLPHSVLLHPKDPSILYVYESLGSCVKVETKTGRHIKIDHESSSEMFAGHGVLDRSGELLFSTQGLSGSRRGVVTARDSGSLRLAKELPPESLHAHQVIHMPGPRSIIAWGNMTGADASHGGSVTFFDYSMWTVVKRIDVAHPILHLMPLSPTEIVALGFVRQPANFHPPVDSSKSSRQNLLVSMPSKVAADPCPLYRFSMDGTSKTFWNEKSKGDFMYNFGLASVKTGERYLTGHTGSNKVLLWKNFEIERSFSVESPNNIAVSHDASEFMVSCKGGVEIYSLVTFEKIKTVKTEGRPIVSLSAYPNVT